MDSEPGVMMENPLLPWMHSKTDNLTFMKKMVKFLVVPVAVLASLILFSQERL
jgi:hypothetical protein